MISTTANRPILLVEHHTTDIFQTFHALKKNHVKNEVIVVRDGLEALDYLFGSGKYAGQTTILPEVIILDVNLPKVGGMEVLAQIRAAERTRNLPVIFLTSSADEQDRIDSHNLGAASCLRKPVDFRNFSDAASQCGLRWLLVDEPKPSSARQAAAS